MHNAEFFGTFDITALTLTLFTAFFFGLVIYLRREDRREGYPIEDDITGRPEPVMGIFFAAQPKTFNLPNGSIVSKPDGVRDGRDLPVARGRVSGTPLQPVGDGMLAGVGPGAYAERAKTPDLTDHGALKVVPLRSLPDFVVDKRDPDPRGMTVFGADRLPAGVVTDVWIDRGEILIRYLEVELAAGAPAGLSVVGGSSAARRVLLPMTMATISRGAARAVKVNAILASQFAGVPALTVPDSITRDEEGRVCAYYGGGYLYATPARTEPLI